MSRRTIAAVTISAMLWHALVGCCAHHGHHAICEHSHAEAMHTPSSDHDSHDCQANSAIAPPSLAGQTHIADPELGCHHHHAPECTGIECHYAGTTDAEVGVDLPVLEVVPFSDSRWTLGTGGSTAGRLTTGPLTGSGNLFCTCGHLRLHLALGVLTI